MCWFENIPRPSEKKNKTVSFFVREKKIWGKDFYEKSDRNWWRSSLTGQLKAKIQNQVR